MTNNVLCSSSAFRCVHQIANNHNYLGHVCLSVRSHGTPRPPLYGYPWLLVFEYFSKICLENSAFIEIWENNGYITWRPTHIYDSYKAISTEYYECVRILALVIRQANIFYVLFHSTIFWTLSHKGRDFRKGNWTWNVCFDFSLHICLKHVSF
jgi:hypothetical protein